MGIQGENINLEACLDLVGDTVADLHYKLGTDLATKIYAW